MIGTRCGRLSLLLLMGGTAGAVFTPAHAQQPLGGRPGGELAPKIEQWRFGEGSREQVRSAQQLSIPLVFVLPLGPSVVLDAHAAWTSGEVRARDEEGAERRYTLRGVSDVRIRGTARLAGDGVLLTLGIGLPTGATELDAEEYTALRVLGAPALRFHPPAVGSGFSAASGIVLTRRLGSWALGMGASYEHRGSYAPLDAAASGMSSLHLNPGDAVRLSLGADRVVGRGTMALLASATLSARDRIRTDAGESRFQLGPAFAVEWQLRTAGAGFSELTVVVWDRYRLQYRDADGASVPGSAGNELEIGVNAMRPLLGGTSLVLGLDARHHTGLRVNEALSTAAMLGGGAQMGLAVPVTGLTLQPFLRVDAGRMHSGNERFGISGVAAGLAISQRR